MPDRYMDWKSTRSYEKMGEVKSSLATGTVFLFVAVVSVIMNNIGVDFIGLRLWGVWLFIPAFFIMLGALSDYSRGKAIRKDVLMVITSRGGGRYTVDEIAADAGVKRKHLLRVLFDLRSEGLVTYRYDAQTGEIIIGESIAYEQDPAFTPVKTAAPQPAATAPVAEGRKFCVFCGQKLEASALFCPNCGSQLD